MEELEDLEIFMKHSFQSNNEKVLEQMMKFTECIVDEKKELEAKILNFRKIIEDKILVYHGTKSITETALVILLEDYDEHFGIKSVTHGTINETKI